MLVLVCFVLDRCTPNLSLILSTLNRRPFVASWPTLGTLCRHDSFALTFELPVPNCCDWNTEEQQQKDFVVQTTKKKRFIGSEKHEIL